MRRRPWLTLALAALLPASLLFALTQGSVHVGWGDVLHAVTNADNSGNAALVRELRLPRALAAMAVGGLLALAGALLQVLLRNPLADPYVLGISGGAAVAALLAMLVGAGGWWVSGSASLGALAAMVLVFGLSRAGGLWTRERLLLTGAVTAAGFGALISLLLALAPDARLPGMIYWLIGDLSGAANPLPALVVLGIALAAAMTLARALNVLARGETVAAALGEDPLRLRLTIYVLASLCTATAVTLAGAIGFVGLVVPHLLRLLGGADHRTLLPNSALFGASFLVIADTLARTAVAPMQIPVGVVTALLGVPAFLVLLSRSR
jgi:iron complex transport system permease protein